MELYLEIGTKRVFAGALDWPGWARSGRDEKAALDALLALGSRYAAALRGTRLGFSTPARAGRIAERLTGTATTDFGAPDVPPSADATEMDGASLRRSIAILRACWRALDRAAVAAEGVELAKGPRGGGRSLDAIVDHVLDAQGAYLRLIGWKVGPGEAGDLERTCAAVVDTLTSVARDGVPPSPRGGKRWTPRFFVRRSAWHVLDHAWEIEDRSRPAAP